MIVDIEENSFYSEITMPNYFMERSTIYTQSTCRHVKKFTHPVM